MNQSNLKAEIKKSLVFKVSLLLTANIKVTYITKLISGNKYANNLDIEKEVP
jgi:hypothetical protein